MKVRCIENNIDNSNWTIGKEYDVDNSRINSNFGMFFEKLKIKDIFEYGNCKFQLVTNVKNKFICPICGSSIEYWNEFFFYKTQKINPITGQYGRIINTKPQEYNCGDMQGFRCTNCDWCVNVINGNCPEYLEKLLK